MKKLLLALTLWVAAAAAYALPTVEQVQAATANGNWTQAQQMMGEVVAARPDSAKAHYVFAEILAHNGQFEQAGTHARDARRLDPQIRFTEPAKFAAFEKALADRGSAASLDRLGPPAGAAPPRTVQRQTADRPAAPAVASSTGLPSWIWSAGIALLAYVAWRAFKARSAGVGAASATSPAGPGRFDPAAGTAAPGYGPPGYGSPMQAPGRSGMLGAGLAGAGGFAAGMLAEKMLGGGREHESGAGAGRDNGGGLVPGMFDGTGSTADSDLADRPIDFGTGNDWDAGDAGSGVDAGGGGDDGGW